jgi:hypothetical protein
MRATRLLVFIFVLVFARWLGMRTGWPDSTVLPAAALTGLVIDDRLATPAGQRLAPREWAVNVAAAVLAGVLMRLAGA